VRQGHVVELALQVGVLLGPERAGLLPAALAPLRLGPRHAAPIVWLGLGHLHVLCSFLSRLGTNPYSPIF